MRVTRSNGRGSCVSESSETSEVKEGRRIRGEGRGVEKGRERGQGFRQVTAGTMGLSFGRWGRRVPGSKKTPGLRTAGWLELWNDSRTRVSWEGLVNLSV